jgi:hypothetical protein
MSDQSAGPAGGESGGSAPGLDPVTSSSDDVLAVPPGGDVLAVPPGGDVLAVPPGGDALAVPPGGGAAPASAPGAGDPAPGLATWTWEPPRQAEPPARRRRAGRVIALVALIVVGVAGLGGGGTLLSRELTRGPTVAEKAAAVQEEIATRWQRYRAGEIFTPTLAYSSSDEGANFTATLVGIAPAASCAAALDPALAAFLRRYGCVTVLRATYLDYSGTQVVTVGVVVMKSTSAADVAIAEDASVPASAGVRAVAFPGTLADQFGGSQRRFLSAISSLGTYLFLAASGYTDGRVSGSQNSTPSLGDLSSGVIASLQTVLTATHGSACQMTDIRC